MANIHDCLQNAMAGGELDAVRGREAQKEFDQLVARYEGSLPRVQAEVAAAEALKEASRASALSRRHKVLAQMQAAVRIRSIMEEVTDPAVALKLLLEYDERAKGIGFTGESVKSLREAMIRSVNNDVQEMLRQTGRNLLGKNRDPALLRNIVRELHNEASGNVAAAEVAKAVRRAQERQRLLFNAHGGDIGKLDDFGMSHSHNVAKIRNATYDRWKADVEGNLAWDRITNHKTGRPFAQEGNKPVSADADAFLRRVYDNLTSRGWNDKDPSMATGGRALYNRHAEHRVLHFRDGTAWMDYNAKYGSSDPFTALVGGLHGMAGDIAFMRVLGPNPRMGLDLAVQFAQKRAGEMRDGKLEAQVRKFAGKAKTMMAHLDGTNNVAESEALGSFFSGVRGLLTSMKLGSAILSAPTDLATITMASKVAGLNPANVLARSAKLMSSTEARSMAASAGYVADTLADMGATAARFAGETFAPEIVQRLTGMTLRASGLNFWTDMHKVAFQMEFGAGLAQQAKRSFDQLEPGLRGMFEQRGISAADWDQLRQTETLFRPKSDTQFITPFHFLEHTKMPRAEAEGLSMRLQMLIEEQLEFAVPTASLEGRAMLVGNTVPGTMGGELLRSTAMFKGFSLSLTLGQIRRIAALPTPLSKASYFAQISAGLIVLGALSVQLKEIAKGRDPRPMTDGVFWTAAFFQGGGVGIFGDFVASETNRIGGGLATTLAGPVIGLGSDLLNPLISNANRLIEGKDTTFGRDGANVLRYNTPVASSLWYTRLAFDRLVADQVQRILDPNAEANWRRQERRRERDFGSATWWDRGAPAPSRSPDFSNAFEEAR